MDYKVLDSQYSKMVYKTLFLLIGFYKVLRVYVLKVTYVLTIISTGRVKVITTSNILKSLHKINLYMREFIQD